MGELRRPTEAAKTKIRQRFQQEAVKGEIAKASRRVLSETPEYRKRVRRRDGTAANWLDEESSVFAAAVYEALMTRVDELGGQSSE